MNTLTSFFQLRVALRHLPEVWRSPHALVEVQRAYRFGLNDPLYPKRQAVRYAFLAAMEQSLSHGGGYCAAKRAARIGESVATYCQELNDRINRERRRRRGDELAEFVGESRSVSHHHRLGIHE